MQAFLILLCILISHQVYCNVIPRAEQWHMIPTLNGTFIKVSQSTLDQMIAKSKAEDAKADFEVIYTLYTTQKPDGEVVQIHNANSLSKSKFNPSNPTRFIIHGWTNNRDSPVNTFIRKAYLKRGHFNVFVVDWNSAAATPNYVSAKNRVETIGKKVSGFIDFLHNSGKMSLSTIYVIGHSLGAHVAGFAGKNVKSGRLNTIIGLDTASPLFSINEPNQRLSQNDALYVETIHTNGGKLGFHEQIGQTAFYPNGGKYQPGCGSDVSGSCSHSRAYEFYAESIVDNRFQAVRCRDFNEIKSGKCSGNYANIRLGGEPSNRGKASGIFYLETNSNSPYGKGQRK